MKPVTKPSRGHAARPLDTRLLRRATSPTAIRRLRLVTGLTLFTYVSTHLLNHALGNISIATMEAGLVVQKFVWQGVLGTAALYTALLTHLALGAWAFYRRRHFGWTRADILQVALGLSIPPLLCNHVFVTRISLALFGTEKGYAQEFYSFWVKSPDLGVQQVVVLIVAWLHGCIGVFFWLRLKPGFLRWAPLLLCGAVVLPLLALLGFYQGGRLTLALAQDPAWQAANLAPSQVGVPAANAALHRWRDWTNLGFAALFALLVAARGLRAWRERRGGSVRITYPNGRVVRVPRGFTVLEASRAGRVPHASICGGRARCSTCRVRVLAGVAHAPPALPGERAVLDRVGAEPGVRLACQLRPTGDIAVLPLIAPEEAAGALRRAVAALPGEERFVVAMVVDMRNSVRLAETRLPFDAVFVIDRFVAAVADAVAEAGGRAAQFTGDGLFATFGLRSQPAAACRDALAAVAGIGRNVAALNAVLAGQGEPIAFGIGVHAGTMVVGEIGFAGTRVFTALGDAANVAARLEALCKSFACEAVVSDDVFRLAGAAADGLELHAVQVRGRAQPLQARTIPHAAALADILVRSVITAATSV